MSRGSLAKGLFGFIANADRGHAVVQEMICYRDPSEWERAGLPPPEGCKYLLLGTSHS